MLMLFRIGRFGYFEGESISFTNCISETKDFGKKVTEMLSSGYVSIKSFAFGQNTWYAHGENFDPVKLLLTIYIIYIIIILNTR